VKVALDTNVLISAYTTRGLSSDVFRLILAEHELVLSRIVLEEFSRVMRDKFGVPGRFVAEFVDDLSLHGVAETATEGSDLPFIRDRDDRLVVQSSIDAGAECFVTGDRDILDVRDQIALPIQTPREFWESTLS
jgi:putative PIN family toxin of toxin-antitoxin system